MEVNMNIIALVVPHNGRNYLAHYVKEIENRVRIFEPEINSRTRGTAIHEFPINGLSRDEARNKVKEWLEENRP